MQKQNLFNIDAEQTVLGSIILHNEYLYKVIEILKPQHFYEPVHQKIYEHISSVAIRSDAVADSVTLKRFFENDETIKSIGGTGYMSTLLVSATGVFDIVNYAKLIIDLALKRELVFTGEGIINRAYENTTTRAIEQIEEAEGVLFKLGTENLSEKGYQNVRTTLASVVENTRIARKRDTNISGVPTGFVDIDKLLGGMQRSDLIILAGRPSMGKTALAVNIAYRAVERLTEYYKKNPNAEKQLGVGFFSLEMSADQLTTRLLAMETGVNSNKFRTGDMTDNDFDSIVDNANKIASLPIYIDDTPALQISALRTRVRRMIRKHNLGLVVVDYLQLLRGTNKQSQQNRVQEVNEITQGLKAIAKEFNIPVLALSQLSRAVEQREDKRPLLSDLRESGSIEQDADVVMFIYREEYYEERRRPSNDSPRMQEWISNMDRIRNKAEVIVSKHRNGATGNVRLHFIPNVTKFIDDAGYLNDSYSY